MVQFAHVHHCEMETGLLQDVVAPFVLENLGCSGDEARLVDCPVVADTPVRVSSPDSDTCDPFAAGGGTFARIACGTSSAAGPPESYLHASCNCDVFPFQHAFD